MARQAYSLNVLVDQLNTMAGNRSKISDGGIGNAAHKATKSDHNPDARGVWHARDVTNDVVGSIASRDAMPGETLATALVRSRDRRIKYLIWNRRIWYPSSGWQAYYGANPHTSHVHISVHAATGDDRTPWALTFDGTALDADSPVKALQRAVRLTADGIWGRDTDGALNLVRDAVSGRFPNVTGLQNVIGTSPDGVFGNASRNALTATIRAIQTALGVPADGDWGPRTDTAWSAARRVHGRGL